MRDSLSVLLEMFVAGNTTPAGTAVCFGQSHAAIAAKRIKNMQLVICLPSFSVSVRDSFITTMLSKENQTASCRYWLYEDIKEARFMRFLLQVRHTHADAFK